MQRPLFLLTNDDGIHAPGLKHLWQALSDLGDITIVAPTQDTSGSGVSITWTRPLHLHSVPWEQGTAAWSLNGTPADCVKMALSAVLDRKPDLILSGINQGSNAGRTALYSGTVGGVIEGTLKGIPGIAFSFCDTDAPSLQTTRAYLRSIVLHFLAHPLPKGSLLNVNFPYRSEERILGLRFAKQGQSYWIEAPDKRTHPEGFPYYWLGGKWFSSEEASDSDVALLEKGYITATPLQVAELTDEPSLRHCKEHWEPLLNPALSESAYPISGDSYHV